MSDTTPGTPKQSWWRRLSSGLKRTSSAIGTAVADLVIRRKLDRAMLDDIEDVLLRADLGTEVAVRIADAVGAGRYDKAISAEPDQAADRPDEAVWILTCSNARYRVRFPGDTAPQVERLD